MNEQQDPDSIHRALSQEEPTMPEENKTVQMTPISEEHYDPLSDTQQDNLNTQEVGPGTVLLDAKYGTYFKLNGEPVTDQDTNALAIMMNQVNEQIEQQHIKGSDADQIRIDTAKRFGFDWKPKSNE